MDKKYYTTKPKPVEKTDKELTPDELQNTEPVGQG